MSLIHSRPTDLEVEPLLTYQQIMNKNIDVLSMSVYLSMLRNAYHETPKGTIVAYGSGLKRAIINRPAVFFVDGTYGSAIEGQVHVTIEGVEVTSDLVATGDHRSIFKITYMPKEVKRIVIHVKWGHIDIHGSPFIVQIVDPEAVRVVGMKRTTCMAVHRTFSFRVTKAFDHRIVIARVRRPDGCIQACELHDLEDGSVLVTHRAEILERKSVEVLVGGVHVHRSPYEAYCVDPEQCSVVLHHPSDGRAVLYGSTVMFKVFADELNIRGIMVNAQAPSGKKEIQWSLKKGDNYEDISEYCPDEIGRHVIHFHNAGVHIQGSPIIIDFILPSNCIMTPPPLYIKVKTTYTLELSVRGAGEADVTMTSSEYAILEPEIRRASDYEYDLQVHGRVVGPSEVSVFFGSYPVEPSPFVIWVVDDCLAFGDSLAPGQFFNAHNPIEFFVDIHQAGPGVLSLATTDPQRSSFPCALSEPKHNWEETDWIVHTIQFVPRIPGNHSVDCIWTLFGDADSIPDSPFKFYVVDPPLTQYYKLPKGNVIFVDTVYPFVVDTNPAGVGAPLHIFVRHEPDGEEAWEEEIQCEREDSGRFYFTMKVGYLGWCQLWTQYNYTDIRPEPRRWRVEEGIVVKDYVKLSLFEKGYFSDPSKCYVFGEAIKPDRFFNAREPIEFFVDVISSGFGFLTSDGRDPQSDPVKVHIAPLQCQDDKWVHTLTFIPYVINVHHMDVFWNILRDDFVSGLEDIAIKGLTEGKNAEWLPYHIPKSPLPFMVVDPFKCQFRGLPRETYVLAFATYKFEVDTNPAGIGADLTVKETQIGLDKVEADPEPGKYMEKTVEGIAFKEVMPTESGVFSMQFTNYFAGWLIMQPQYNFTDILPIPLKYDIVDPKMYWCRYQDGYHNMDEVYSFNVINVLVHERYLRYRTVREVWLGSSSVETPMMPVITKDTDCLTGFQPENVGRHNIEVTCVGYHVNYSPFEVPVCHAPWCIIEGLPEEPYVIVEKPNSFTIDTIPAYPGAELTVTAKHSEEPEVVELEWEPVPYQSGVFQVHFTAHRPAGYLELNFYYNRRLIRPPAFYDIVDPWQYQAIRPLGIERIRYGVIFDILNVTIHGKYLTCESRHDMDEAAVELYLHNEVATCSFQPRYVGYYKTEVKCVGINIPGSPFDIPVCDPESCYVSGIFPLYILVENPTVVQIFTKEAGPGELTAHFESEAGPSALKVDLHKRKENGCEAITYTAHTVCDNLVTLRWADYLICRSPLEMRAIDPSKLMWRCPKMHKGRILIEDTTEFNLDCRFVGNVYPLINAASRGTADYPIHLTVVQPRDFIATFTPTVVGEMQLNVTFAGYPTPSFPRQLIVRRKIDPNMVYVTGRPLKKCFSGLVESVTVHTPEVDLLEIDVLNVFLQSRDRHHNLDDQHVRVEMKDLRDTTYQTRFLIPSPGPYLLNCMVEEHHCRGSPYKLNAVPGPDATKCVVYGKIKDPHPYFAIQKTIEFEVDTTDCGSGSLEMSVKDQFGRSISIKSIKAKKNKRTIYEGKMVLPKIAYYVVSITWSDYPIPGSPFTIWASNPLLCSFRELPDPAIPNPDAFAPIVNVPFSFVVDSTKAGKGLVASILHYDNDDVEQLQVVEEEEGLFSVTVCPKHTGWIEMTVLFNETSILPALWRCQVVDPSRYSVTPVTKIMRVGHPVSIPLLNVCEGTPYITVHAYHESDHTLDGHVDFGQVNSNGIFYPKAIGEYNVVVNCGGVSLKGSPFSVQVCDPDACKVIGHVAEVYIVGEKSHFHVNTLQAGPGTFSHTYEQTKGSGTALDIQIKFHKEWHEQVYEEVTQVERDEEEWGNNVYDVKIIGNQFGSANVQLTWAGYRIPHIPYVMKVVDPASCMMSLPIGLAKVKPNMPYTFVVDTYLCNNMLAEVRPLMLENDCYIECQQVGKHTKVVFSAKYPGDYPIEVRCYRVHVQGSPFSIHVTDEELVDVLGVLPQVLPIGGFTKITVCCIEAGAGPLESCLETTSSEGPPVKIDIEAMREHLDRYEVIISALRAGVANLKLMWGGHVLPRFPHTVRVVDLSNCKTVLFRPARGYYVDGEKLNITVSGVPWGVPLNITVYSPDYEATVQQWPNKKGIASIEYILATVGTYRVEVYAFNILLNGFPLEVDVVEAEELRPVLPLVEGDGGLQIVSGSKAVDQAVEASAREIRRSLLIRQSYVEQTAITEVSAQKATEEREMATMKGKSLSRSQSKQSFTGPPPSYHEVGGGLAVAVKAQDKKERRESKRVSRSSQDLSSSVISGMAGAVVSGAISATVSGADESKTVTLAENDQVSVKMQTAVSEKKQKTISEKKQLKKATSIQRSSSAMDALTAFAGGAALGLLPGQLPEGDEKRLQKKQKRKSVMLPPKATITQLKQGDKGFSLANQSYMQERLFEVISGRQSSLQLNLHSAGLVDQGKLVTFIKDDATGEEHPVNITDEGNGLYTIEFLLERVTHYRFVILYEGVHIMGSPFSFDCAPQIDIFSLATSGIICESGQAIMISEKDIFLRVDTTSCGSGQLAVLAQEDDGTPIKYSMQEEWEESTQTLYTLIHIDVYRVGIYILELYYRGLIPLLGSPFTINVVDPLRAVVSGLPPRTPINPHDTVSFVVDASEAGKIGPEVSVCDPSGIFAPVLPDQESGGYFTYKYSTIIPGKHTIYVHIAGQPVRGSPFSVTVLEQVFTGLTLWEESLENYQGTFLVNQVTRFEFAGVPLDLHAIKAQAHGPTTDSPVNIQFVPGAVYSASFVPTEPGLYHVFVECAGYQIEGSPFVIGVADPSKCYILGERPKHVHVNHETVVIVKASDAGVGKVSVTIDGSEESDLIDYRVLSLGLYTFAIILKGKQVGPPSTVEVNFAGNTIPECSFEVNTLDPSQCTVECEAFRTGRSVLAESIGITVNTEGAGTTQDIEFVIQGPTLQVDVVVSKDEAGNFVGRFSPWETGLHTVEVLWGGVRVGQGQYSFQVEYTQCPSFEGCLVAGPGLKQVNAKQETRFVAVMGEKGLLKRNNFSVSVKGVSHEVPVNIIDNENGTYTVIYTVSIVGAYVLTVKHHKKLIYGSPFKITALQAADAQQVTAYGSPFSEHIRFVAGEPIHFFVDTSRGGQGKLSAFARGPKDQHVEVHVIQHLDESDKYSLLVDPTVQGGYSVSVLWAGQHIKGSPYRFMVLPAPDASKVLVEGPGLQDDILGSKGLFFIDARKAGTGVISVRVHGFQDTFRVNLSPLHPPDTRLLKASYEAQKPGPYTIFVRWCGRHVPGSPFSVTISRGEGDESDGKEEGWDKWNFQDESQLLVTRPGDDPAKGKPAGWYLDLTRQEDVDFVAAMQARQLERQSEKPKHKFRHIKKQSRSKERSDVDYWPNYLKANLLATSQQSLDTDISLMMFDMGTSETSSLSSGDELEQRSPTQWRVYKRKRVVRPSKKKSEGALQLSPVKSSDVTFGEVKEPEHAPVYELSPQKKGLFRVSHMYTNVT